MKEAHGIQHDRLIGRTSLIGTMTPVAPIANWALDVKPIRMAGARVHRSAPMPRAYGCLQSLVQEAHARCQIRARAVR